MEREEAPKRQSTCRWGVGEELISATIAVVGQGYRAAAGSVLPASTLPAA
jgi:hypothetical protein